jgi:hypothetical protein
MLAGADRGSITTRSLFPLPARTTIWPRVSCMSFTGMNLEHIFDGDRRDADDSQRIFFEPRHAPMTFRRLSATEAELYQPTTPTFHLESWTRFTLVAPQAIDFHFRFRRRSMPSVEPTSPLGAKTPTCESKGSKRRGQP